MFELVHSPLHPSDVEVHVVGKIRAHTGLGVSESAVERSPAHTDHHGGQAQQEEEEPGVPAHLICISGKSKSIENQNMINANSAKMRFQKTILVLTVVQAFVRFSETDLPFGDGFRGSRGRAVGSFQRHSSL